MSTLPRNENGQLTSGAMLAKRYRIERFLAGGGMGRVYLARDQRLADRLCAIKEVFDRFNDPEERARAIEYFHREAGTLSQLKHPAIPAIVDRFGEGNCHYLVMDYIDGTNLEDEVAAQGGSLPESRVIEIARELCEVLTYLHGFHPPIIYRDMKPGNVILTPAGHAVLIDFGIARIFTPQGKATLIGTPGFAPPEQYAGQVDERSDLYGLAATLHYLLTGRDPEKYPPFSFPPVHTLRPETAPFLAQAIDKALAYKPEDRPQSVAAFKEMFLYGQGVELVQQSAFAAKSSTRPLDPLEAPFTTSLGEPESLPAPRPASHWRHAVTVLLFIGLVVGSGYQLATHPQWLDLNEWARWGENIPWEKIEAWLPERGQTWLREFVAELPWERDKRLRALREDPAELISLAVFNSSRDGTPLAEQKSVYSENEVKYLTWEATLKNRLVGVEGHTYQLEGQFIDPEGGTAGKSEAMRFASSNEAELSLRGVTLLEGLKERAKGEYRLDLYLGEKKLGSQTLHIEAEPKKVANASSSTSPNGATSPNGTSPSDAILPVAKTPPTPVLPADELAAIEETKRLAVEEKRQARIQEAKKNPLTLMNIRFLNTDREGNSLPVQAVSGFELSQVRFITWEAVFRNNLFNLDSSYHRLEGTFRGPRGQLLGTVEDQKAVGVKAKQVSFTARLGNSSGGAFEPGVHRVDFYLNGHPLLSKEFVIEDDRTRTASLPPSTPPSFPSPRPAEVSNQAPNVLTGSILGIIPNREVALEIDLQPQGNGRVRGNLTIREPGYGTGMLEGRENGRRIEFHSAVGRETYHFEGLRDGDRVSGTYRSLTSGGTGRWSVKANSSPSS
ncbi:MAG: serine/threonine protein kinase [Candidatus Binatia bacterium]